jgi:hypothetical protein
MADFPIVCCYLSCMWMDYRLNWANAVYISIKVCLQTLLCPNPMISCLACSVTWLAIRIMLLITVRSLRRWTLWRVFLLPMVSCPIIRSILYANMVSSSTNSLVSNFPDGSRSTSISVLISLWNCSHSPCAW